MDRTIRRLAKLGAALLLASGTSAGAGAARWSTWHPWQLDSVLVAWVLVSTGVPAQSFESVPRGTLVPPDRAIDTPDSPFRRTAQRTAFEEAVRVTGLQHPCVTRLREAVRVVELAPWRKPEFARVEAFEARVLKAIPAVPAAGGLDPALAEVDRYCEDPSWRPGA